MEQVQPVITDLTDSGESQVSDLGKPPKKIEKDQESETSSIEGLNRYIVVVMIKTSFLREKITSGWFRRKVTSRESTLWDHKLVRVQAESSKMAKMLALSLPWPREPVILCCYPDNGKGEATLE
ncbi:MAG: hypothetical protein ACYCQJ_14565 [Nitrososphaerales archaeon]